MRQGVQVRPLRVGCNRGRGARRMRAESRRKRRGGASEARCRAAAGPSSLQTCRRNPSSLASPWSTSSSFTTPSFASQLGASRSPATRCSAGPSSPPVLQLPLRSLQKAGRGGGEGGGWQATAGRQALVLHPAGPGSCHRAPRSSAPISLPKTQRSTQVQHFCKSSNSSNSSNAGGAPTGCARWTA